MFIGIDPGIAGAVAFVDGATGKASVFDLPIRAAERRIDGLALALLMREHAPASVGGRVFLEKLHARASGGGMVQMGSMMKTVGIIIGAIDCTKFPLVEVIPQTWKRMFGLIEAPGAFRVKKTDAERKAGSLAVARRLYPSLEAELRRAKDDGRAEALLIAHWGRVTQS
jgi:crossover junction endodeoxyribonuclease RuvC